MYVARFSYDLLPSNRQQGIDFVRKEVETAFSNGLDARLRIVRLTCRDQKRPRQDARVRCRGCIPPFVRRLSSEGPQRRSRDEMVLKVEGVVNGGMHAEEALSGSSRFEALHLALSSPDSLMRVLRTIVAPKPLFVRTTQP